MPEITDAQQQERRKRAGDLLKMADKLFKGSDFEGAARLVNMAMDADPKNAYALAYQERIKYAIEQRDYPEARSSACGPAPFPPAPVAGADTAARPITPAIRTSRRSSKRHSANSRNRKLHRRPRPLHTPRLPPLQRATRCGSRPQQPRDALRQPLHAPAATGSACSTRRTVRVSSESRTGERPCGPAGTP